MLTLQSQSFGAKSSHDRIDNSQIASSDRLETILPLHVLYSSFSINFFFQLGDFNHYFSLFPLRYKHAICFYFVGGTLLEYFVNSLKFVTFCSLFVFFCPLF